MTLIVKLLLLVTLSITTILAKELVVVTNPKNSFENLNKKDIAALYLDKKRFVNGKRVVLLNLTLNDPIRVSFEKKILKKSKEDLQKIWLRAHFEGNRPPKVVMSQEAAAKFILKVENSLGYLEKRVAENFKLKIIFEWND